MYKIGIDARLWNETGVGRYIRNLVGELQKSDAVDDYILFVLEKDLNQVKSQITNSKFQIKIANIKWHTIQEQIEFPKILKREKLDLVHFPYFSIPIRYTGKYILTIHDLILHHFPTGKASTKSPFVYWFKHMTYKYVLSQAAKKAEKIITVSEATKKEIIKHVHVPEQKVVVTYEGIDSRFKIQDLRFKKEYGKYFLYVGNAYPHKNLETLLKAFKLFCHPQQSERSCEIKLILVGKQDYFYKRLEEKVKNMDLGDVVEFRYNTADIELAHLYANTLALVMPSLMEGFGLPVLEAMGKGCLVAVSDIPVFHEIAGDVPVYFPPTDVNTLTNVLESIAKGRITDAKERQEKGKEIARKFSWEKMVKETLVIYKSCLRV